MILSDTVSKNILSISDDFPALLLDAYGVFWGGNALGLFPKAKETLETLVSSGKVIGILSNTTQLSSNEIKKYEKHGLEKGKHYHFFLSSGDVVRSLFMNDQLPFPTPLRKYWLFGSEHPQYRSHHALFENSPYSQTDDIDKADFGYVPVPHVDGKDQLDPEVFRSDVAKVLQRKLPLVCANPDRFAHEGNPPELVVRQGSIGFMYKEMGGKVFFVGKPFSRVYENAMNTLTSIYGVHDRKKVLMVGDTPETDIRGANDFGLSSALVLKTGIMKNRIDNAGFQEALESLPPRDIPNFFIERL